MKKGFTLIELLVVITIIGLLTIITVPSIITINKRIKQKEGSTTRKMIYSAAKLYGRDKKSSLLNMCEVDETCCTKVTLQKLIDQGYYDVNSGTEAEIKNSLNINNFSDYKVLITYKNASVGAEEFKKTDAFYSSTDSPCKHYEPNN